MTKKEAELSLHQVKELEKLNLSFLHLTVNENQLSQTANGLLASKLSERYYFGAGKENIVDFKTYTFVGMPAIAQLLDHAKIALKKMSGASVVNMSCYSGLHAMMCSILSTTKPGDLILSIPFEDGGHAATKTIIESIGRRHAFAKFNQSNFQFDISQTAKIFKEKKAKAIYIDISTHLGPLNIKQLRNALGNKALIIYDASHSLGLILGQKFPSPFEEGADVISANTHKTFPGPQKGLIMFKDKILGTKADQLIKTSFVSSAHISELIALAITILEMEKFGKDYCKQIIKNSKILSEAFLKLGYKVRSYSNKNSFYNEQIHVYLDKRGDKTDLYKRLVKNNISTNFMQNLGGRLFARIGTQEITRRGMKEKDMITIARLFHQALSGDLVKSEVVAFNNRFKKIHYSFDKKQND